MMIFVEFLVSFAFCVLKGASVVGTFAGIGFGLFYLGAFLLKVGLLKWVVCALVLAGIGSLIE